MDAQAVRRQLKEEFALGKLEGPVEDVVVYLQSLAAQLHRQYRGRYPWFELKVNCDDDKLQILGCRWETEKEQQRRVAKEIADRAEQEQERERRRIAFQRANPHICPTCGSRYAEAKFISGNECPGCMNISAAAFRDDYEVPKEVPLGAFR